MDGLEEEKNRAKQNKTNENIVNIWPVVVVLVVKFSSIRVVAGVQNSVWIRIL